MSQWGGVIVVLPEAHRPQDEVLAELVPTLQPGVASPTWTVQSPTRIDPASTPFASTLLWSGAEDGFTILHLHLPLGALLDANERAAVDELLWRALVRAGAVFGYASGYEYQLEPGWREAHVLAPLRAGTYKALIEGDYLIALVSAPLRARVALPDGWRIVRSGPEGLLATRLRVDGDDGDE